MEDNKKILVLSQLNENKRLSLGLTKRSLTMECLNCNKELVQIPQKRVKCFCNSTCRSNYWQKEKRKIKSQIKSITNPKKEIVSEPPSEVDNSEIQKQIEEVNLETKPYIVSQTQFDRYKEKKIAELKKQLK